MNHLLTGIRDLDREILNKLKDTDLLTVYALNKTFNSKVCNDDYFRLRTENGFPETIHYKDYIKFTNWKSHYLKITKYINLLDVDLNYKYKSEDSSPELCYMCREFFLKRTRNGLALLYNNNLTLVFACLEGKLPIVKYLKQHGADINYEYGQPIMQASFGGRLEIVKYLVENNADIGLNESALKWASAKGHLPVVKYLVENKYYLNGDESITWASTNGHLSVVKYLVETGMFVYNKSEELRLATDRNDLNMIEYLSTI